MADVGVEGEEGLGSIPEQEYCTRSSFLKLTYSRIQYVEKLKKARSDTIDYLIRYYERDDLDSFLHFVRFFAWTYDPREKFGLSRLAFDIFPRQEELCAFFFDCYKNRSNGLVEKARDLGVTWLVCYFLVYKWLFGQNFSGLVITKNIEALDKKGSINSVFEKIRYTIDELPSFLLPRRYNRDKHALHKSIINPYNGNAITGEGGKSAGRSSRASICIMDEAGFIENAESVFSAVSQTSNCLVKISTACSPSHPFYKEAVNPKANKFTFRADTDPRKQPFNDYLQDQYKRFGSVIVNREILIDYLGTEENPVIPKTYIQSTAISYIEIEKWLSEHPDLDKQPIEAGLDVADGGDDNTVLIIRKGPFVLARHVWKVETMEEYVNKLHALLIENSVETIYVDVNGVGAGLPLKLSSYSNVPYRIIGVKYQKAPSKLYLQDNKVNTCYDRFQNMRAEVWWRMRLACQNSLSYREGSLNALNDCLFIPHDMNEVFSDLSILSIGVSSAGKLLVESKEQLKSRGLSSPDYGDALSLTYYPKPIFRII